MEVSFVPVRYQEQYYDRFIEFMEKCLPESGRVLDINGKHSCYKDIGHSFEAFWCMFDGDEIIGASAVKGLDDRCCELRSLYLRERYHGKGYGRMLLNAAIDYSRGQGYEKMYLDALSTSTKAIALYRRAGFVCTERYNNNLKADVFMVLELFPENR